MTGPIRYRSADEDSARWLGFDVRDGDIVISSRSKCGTTWVQMICALLVFRTPELPRPLAELSPWLDWLVVPRAEVVDALDRQGHRRFIKTHTPLDGLPLSPRATYVVVARHPLDAALSLYHQAHNLDRARIGELLGDPVAAPRTPMPAADVWLRSWIGSEASAVEALDSIRGFFHHLNDAWRRRGDENVVLVHYDDLVSDLPGEMSRLAARLGLDIAAAEVAELAGAATFEVMKSQSDLLVPDPVGVLKSNSAFFREGVSGAGTRAVHPGDLAAYRRRAAALAPPDLLAWLHRG